MSDQKKLLAKVAFWGEMELKSYSGRGMYGKECVCITADCEKQIYTAMLRGIAEMEDGDIEEAGYSSIGEMLADLADLIECSTVDDMGLGVVVYWKRISFDAPDEE